MGFPYQLTAFLQNEPTVGESVYAGENGWYPQITLKRRFRIEGIGEEDLISLLETYCSSRSPFTIHTNSLSKPERMPVKINELEHSHELVSFHMDFISTLGKRIVSRYPERDGENYLPHITAEYDNKMVINPDEFMHKEFRIEKIWLLKDVNDQDSKAFKAFYISV